MEAWSHQSLPFIASAAEIVEIRRGVNFWWGIYQHLANVQELISKHGIHSCHCELHVILVFRIGIEMMFAYC